MPFTNVVDLVIWIVESGGASVISYWLLAQLEKSVEKIGNLSGEWKRVLAIVQAIVIGAIIAFLGSLIGVYKAPQDAAGWANLLITVGITASVGHQLIHGFRELPKESAA